MAKSRKTSVSRSSFPKAVLVLIVAVAIGLYAWSKPSAQVASSSRRTKNITWNHPKPEVLIMPKEMESVHGVEDITKLNVDYVSYLNPNGNPNKHERPMGATFVNFYKFDITMWWNDGTEEGQYSGVIKKDSYSATNTYTSHVFHFRKRSDGTDLESLTMRDDRHFMILGPSHGDTSTLNSQKYKDAKNREVFMKSYHEEHGVPWLSHYPREKPVWPFWPADFIGQTHKVKSFVPYFTSESEQGVDPVDLNLVVLSVRPLVIAVENVLNQVEIDHITELGEKVVHRSSVGDAENGFESATRTSENGWIPRKKTSLLDTVYHRLADVLGVSDDFMEEGRDGNIESLQFVRYKLHQKYEPHHDFGNDGTVNQRFSTLLMYLNVPEEGGATSFPKAFDGKGLVAKPPPGSAVLFYSMLPDGNGDDLSLHSGMEVTKGMKYVCNLWAWDPKYKQ